MISNRFKLSKKLAVLLLVLVIVSVVFLAHKLYVAKKCDILACINLLENDRYKLTETYQNDETGFRGLYQKIYTSDEMIRVDVKNNVLGEDAKKIIDAQVIKMKGLFENAASPYPGEISDEIECSKEYKPVFLERDLNNVHISTFQGYLNDRLVFGACTQDQAVYKGTLSLFYCSNSEKLYQLELIVKKEKYEENPEVYKQILDSISCY